MSDKLESCEPKIAKWVAQWFRYPYGTEGSSSLITKSWEAVSNIKAQLTSEPYIWITLKLCIKNLTRFQLSSSMESF